MVKKYVTIADGIQCVAGTRVSLDSLVYLYREGMSPEAMADSYPALSLEQIHGAIAYYLANQAEVDAGVRDRERFADVEREHSIDANHDLISRLRRARNEASIPG